MKRAAKIVLAALLFAGGAASAQLVDRVWDNGSVWQITQLKIKPGQYNAVMKYLHDVALPRIAYRKQAGDVLAYHILSVSNAREHEPDVLIVTEYRNMAVFDRTPAYFEDMDRRFAGSLQAREAQNVQARSLAESRGSLLAREITFLH